MSADRYTAEDYERVMKEIESLAGTDEREHPDNLVILSALRIASMATEEELAKAAQTPDYPNKYPGLGPSLAEQVARAILKHLARR